MEFFLVIGALVVASYIVFSIAGEKHESKAFWFMGLILLVALGLMIFSGDGGGPTGGQFDHLRAK